MKQPPAADRVHCPTGLLSRQKSEVDEIVKLIHLATGAGERRSTQGGLTNAVEVLLDCDQ